MKTVKDIRYENLLKLIKAAGSTVRLAEKTGISANYLRQIKNKNAIQNGKPKGIGDKIAAKLEDGFDKPRGWLDVEHSKDIEIVAFDVNEFNTLPSVAAAEDIDYSDTHIQIELYDIKLSAGHGKGCAMEWIPRKSDEPLIFRQAWFRHKNLNPNSCKAMYVRGQSMSPVLKDLDTVIVNIDDTEIIDREVYALLYKGNFYIKQVVRKGDTIELISFNPDPQYSPIVIDETQLPELKIIGRQIWRGG